MAEPEKKPEPVPEKKPQPIPEKKPEPAVAKKEESKGEEPILMKLTMDNQLVIAHSEIY